VQTYGDKCLKSHSTVHEQFIHLNSIFVYI